MCHPEHGAGNDLDHHHGGRKDHDLRRAFFGMAGIGCEVVRMLPFVKRVHVHQNRSG